MSKTVEFHLNKATAPVIIEHLLHCDDNFIPPLSQRVLIKDYASKIAKKAMQFEAWSGDRLIGLVAAYCAPNTRIAFISNVSVLKSRIGEGIASSLLCHCIEYASASGMKQINLEVARDNIAAIKLYEKIGFFTGNLHEQFVAMQLLLNSGENHE